MNLRLEFSTIPEMNKYALTVIVKSELDEKTRKELLDSVTKKMGDNVKEELWGVREMSYPIRKLNKAYYAHYFFEVDPKLISPLDKTLKIEEDILRYLLVRV